MWCGPHRSCCQGSYVSAPAPAAHDVLLHIIHGHGCVLQADAANPWLVAVMSRIVQLVAACAALSSKDTFNRFVI